MEKQSRFLGICILAAAAIVAAALVYHAQCGRYQFHQSSPPEPGQDTGYYDRQDHASVTTSWRKTKSEQPVGGDA